MMPHSTLTELCGVYSKAEQDICTALDLLASTQSELCRVFDGGACSNSFNICARSYDLPRKEDALKRLHLAAWSALVNRLELRRLLSLARIKELDAQLTSGEGLPPITVANVLAMLENNRLNAGQYLEEKVRETYEWLRPGGYSLREYKTNQASERAGVGRKIILTWNIVRGNYSGRGWQINYDRRDNVRALDQVFHMLDGKPIFAQSYNGALCDAVEAQTKDGGNQFKTDYFAGRCFGNGNLHLEILRADLLDMFNAVAGGMRLAEYSKPQPKARPARAPRPQPASSTPDRPASVADEIAAVMASWQNGTA